MTLKNDITGWIALDKPFGMTSTHAVAVIKRLFQARKVGHAGTLDPLATGVLPIALGQATRTVPFVMDGHKRYQFTVAWGSQTDTDDKEGRVTATSDVRPTVEEIERSLPRYMGLIQQTPPQFSAIKLDGERAYHLARQGRAVDIKPRQVSVDKLSLLSHEKDHAVFELDCGKGVYVRSIARDLGRDLGCFGHVAALRRTQSGPFEILQCVTLDALREKSMDLDSLKATDVLQPVCSALKTLPRFSISKDAALYVRQGRVLSLEENEDAQDLNIAYVADGDEIIALGKVTNGLFYPSRVFPNLDQNT